MRLSFFFLFFPFFSCVPSILLLLFLQTQHKHTHARTRANNANAHAHPTPTQHHLPTSTNTYYLIILREERVEVWKKGSSLQTTPPSHYHSLLIGATHRERNRDTHTGHTHRHAAPSNSRDYSTLANVNEKKQQREKAATNTERGKEPRNSNA